MSFESLKSEPQDNTQKIKKAFYHVQAQLLECANSSSTDPRTMRNTDSIDAWERSENILSQLNEQGITPENNEIAAVLREVFDLEQRLDNLWPSKPSKREEREIEEVELQEQLKVSKENLKGLLKEQYVSGFEDTNAALSNEWPRIMLYADMSRDANGLHRLDYGVDEKHLLESESRHIEGILERLAYSGVTPENNEVASALKSVIDAENALDELRGEQVNEDVGSERAAYIRDFKPEAVQNVEKAKEALKDAVVKHQPAVTGAY